MAKMIMAKMIPIEEVEPGWILCQDVQDIKRENVVYSAGVRLTTDMINNILSLDYLEIKVDQAQEATPASKGDSMPTRSYKPGEFIFYQGEPAHEIFILKKGIVEVMVTEAPPPSDDTEKARRYVGEHGKVISQIRGKNVKFGEMASILQGVRSASIKANTEVEVSCISTNEAAFKQTLMHSPKLGISIASTVAQRLKHMQRGVVKIHSLHALLIKKIQVYQGAYSRIKDSLTTKNETRTTVWLSKIINELKNIPGLTDIRKFKLPELIRKEAVLELKEQILPPELEIPVNINSYLTVAGHPQEYFFILRKGKVVVPLEESWQEIYATCGQMMDHVEPLSNPFRYKGTHKRDLKTISPVRVYKIPIVGLERFAQQHPKLVVFFCKSMANQLIDQDEFLLKLMKNFEADLAVLASGDTNFRRGFKKLSRVLEKFSKDPLLTKVELSLAESMREMVDKDYASFKDKLNEIHFQKPT